MSAGGEGAIVVMVLGKEEKVASPGGVNEDGLAPREGRGGSAINSS